MAKLTLDTADQSTALTTADGHLENAMLEGTQYNSSGVLDPMQYYDTFDNNTRATVKLVWKQILAAVMKTLNIRKPLPTPVSGVVTITYKKSDGITNGTLTFTDGILTSHT